MSAKRKAKTAKPQYPCTDCGGDAFVGLSNWSGPEGQIIGKKERLCLSCARKRGVSNPLAPSRT